MTKDSATNTILEIIRNFAQVEREVVSITSTLAEIGVDSLDAVELIMGLEEQFGIDLDDAEATSCKTVQDVVTVVLKAAELEEPEPPVSEFVKEEFLPKPNIAQAAPRIFSTAEQETLLALSPADLRTIAKLADEGSEDAPNTLLDYAIYQRIAPKECAKWRDFAEYLIAQRKIVFTVQPPEWFTGGIEVAAVHPITAFFAEDSPGLTVPKAKVIAEELPLKDPRKDAPPTIKTPAGTFELEELAKVAFNAFGTAMHAPRPFPGNWNKNVPEAKLAWQECAKAVITHLFS